MSSLTAPASTGVLSRTVIRGQWNGVAAEAVEWQCTGESIFDLRCSRYRLGFVLEQGGGYCETRPHPRIRNGYRHHGRPFLTLSAPDMPVWACGDDVRYTRSMALSFDSRALSDRLDDSFEPGRDLTPRFNVEHPPLTALTALAAMIAEECRSPGPFGQLYGDSLILSVLVGWTRFARNHTEPRRRHRLAPWQLGAAVEYMAAEVKSRITLEELAAVTGLSQSHFSRAFKASTGVTPYQWHLNERIRRAQLQLLRAKTSIAQVASDMGFADAAHFIRVFARVTGATPAAWRRERGRGVT
jgi:AraC-like DNA-binding protein